MSELDSHDIFSHFSLVSKSHEFLDTYIDICMTKYTNTIEHNTILIKPITIFCGQENDKLKHRMHPRRML